MYLCSRIQKQYEIMKKNIGMIWAVSALLCLFAGCGGHGETTSAHAEHDEHEHEHEGHEHEGHGHSASAAGNSSLIVLSPEQAREAGVVAEVLQSAPFRQVIPVSGELLPAQGEEALIVANVAGTVHFSRALTEGLRVGRGTPLFVISSERMAEGNPVERARIAYEAAKKEYERAEGLVEDKIVSEKEFVRIKENYENARLTYKALADGRTTGKGGTRVASTIDGYVKECMVAEGDYVEVGQPLANITCNCRIYLRADVPEKHYGDLKRIRSANFRTSYGDKVFALDELNGRMLSYGQTTGGKSYYLPVTFELDNREGLVPGSFAEVWLLSDEQPGVLSVPLTALTEEQGVHAVYVQLDEDCYERREVKLGMENGQRVQLLSGVKPGERVVTEGATQVRLASASKAIPGHSHEH